MLRQASTRITAHAAGRLLRPCYRADAVSSALPAPYTLRLLSTSTDGAPPAKPTATSTATDNPSALNKAQTLIQEAAPADAELNAPNSKDNAKSSSTSATTTPTIAELGSRWYSDLARRVRQLRDEAKSERERLELDKLREDMRQDWLRLIAGAEGFATASEWRGLHNHPVAWGDMDIMGHVNNVVYNKWAETARVNLIRQLAHASDSYERRDEWLQLVSPADVGLIMRSIKTEYKAPVTYPDWVTVLHQLVEKPTHESTSLHFKVGIYSHLQRRLVARCFEEIVVYDYPQARRTQLKGYMVEKLDEMYDAQVQNRKYAERKAAQILKRVTQLERNATGGKSKVASA